MKLLPFSILTVLALILAGLTLMETMMYRAWEQAQDDQRILQRKVAYYQKLNTFTEQLLRRMAIDSQRDPALAQVLKDNNIKVVISNPNQQQDAATPQPTPGEVTTPSDKTVPTPSHP